MGSFPRGVWHKSQDAGGIEINGRVSELQLLSTTTSKEVHFSCRPIPQPRAQGVY